MNNLMNEILKHQQTAIDKNYLVFGTYLQGSQNYKLDLPTSDVDTKTIVIPTFEDIALNRKPISTTHILDDNSHDDQKDIRLMFSTFHKQNINFLEILFTDYYIPNPIFKEENEELREMADDIAQISERRLISCIKGMAYEKFKALEHPYPATIDKIKKFGYDPKQLHHILRLQEFIQRLYNGEKFKDCLISKNIQYLTSVKAGFIDLETARVIASLSVNEIVSTASKFDQDEKVNNDIIDRMNDLLIRVLKKSLLDEMGID